MNNSSSEQHMIPHVFEDCLIFQTAQDTVVAGRLIPKGYCNLTHVLKAASIETGKTKRWSNYIKSESNMGFLSELAKKKQCPIFDDSETSNDVSAQPCGFQPLIIVIKGGDPSEQGTWGHVEVALHLAHEMSPKFAVWGTEALLAIINGDFKPLTEEAALAQVKLQEQWQNIRNQSKEAFWNLGDATKEYIRVHSKQLSDANKQFMYSNCQDGINRGLFGKTSKTIRLELGVKDLLRDHYGKKALKRLDIIQIAASSLIVTKDIEPYQAVTQVLEMFSFPIMDYRE